MFNRDHLESAPWMLQLFAQQGLFDGVMSLQGEVFRDVPGRKTIRVELQGKSYFVKQHFGVGWPEIFKNLLSAKWPILTAETEWSAIQKLDEVGIPTTPAVAYGVRGANPATLQSFLITEDLGDIISLETLCADWKINPPDRRFKRHLLIKVAELARKLHDGGMNHRDFYICHICLDNAKLAQGEIYLYLIDLHRVGIRPVIASSDRMKDMAALYFSAMEAGLSKRDYLRVLRHYRQMPLRRIFKEELDFWCKVSVRAAKLYQKFHGKMPETLML
ncbi:MAG: lipopolysaccharide core heptose(I) kinase RfaP [Nitrosomonadales bacterium]|nr:lipopolysaccharide core heptose(I) kinase RfaP [Nitrosomonadales bacterium]